MQDTCAADWPCRPRRDTRSPKLRYGEKCRRRDGVSEDAGTSSDQTSAETSTCTRKLELVVVDPGKQRLWRVLDPRPEGPIFKPPGRLVDTVP